MTRFFSFLLLSFLLVQCSATARFNKTKSGIVRSRRGGESSSLVRVLLDDDLQKKTVSFDVPVFITDGQEKVAEIEAGEKFSFTASEEGVALKVGKKKYSLNLCGIEPESAEELLAYNGKSYQGSFSILSSQGKILLINSLDIEDYLKGVLYSEMGVASSKPEDIEALKAFAVCARNYTVMKLNQTGRLFDLYSDTRDQVYEGCHPSKTLINQAVEETRHLILKYNGEPAMVLYSSSCGGKTEKADNILKQKNIPYLSGVDEGDEPYCSIAPGFNWEENYSAQDIINYLTGSGYIKKGEYSVKNIEIKNRYESGRVNELLIALEDSEGEPLEVTIVGNKIRYVIRSKAAKSLLRSTLFDIKPLYEDGSLKKVTFHGRGSGHGVGLCQWGAIGLSRKGIKFEDILSFYFPGTRLSEM